MLSRMSDRDAQALETLATSERPARVVGLFTAREMKGNDLERLVAACLQSMREEDRGAELTLAPLAGTDRTFRVTVRDGAEMLPHDCLVQVYGMREPGSPHRRLLDHVGAKDAELSEAASHLARDAQSYIAVASGRLDDATRVHAFENLISLFTSALGAAIVDAAAALVTTDPGEWADALEMSLQLEREMGVLRR
jgi:hypothetical protein